MPIIKSGGYRTRNELWAEAHTARSMAEIYRRKYPDNPRAIALAEKEEATAEEIEREYLQ
ncbi:hypothetical protein [Ruegeria sp. HKCCD6109]|uniref:hypothetical protein n=1 Tax=Ruegeria sp. HKCCD6109 TaxID=2683017 RepID=UPI00149289EC|nr:hypothetical protein [Ruegeria sp. HKCCD6109]NOD65782.1 hypothetical protein [Ruegeria sp. HKCCD6109]